MRVSAAPPGSRVASLAPRRHTPVSLLPCAHALSVSSNGDRSEVLTACGSLMPIGRVTCWAGSSLTVGGCAVPGRGSDLRPLAVSVTTVVSSRDGQTCLQIPPRIPGGRIARSGTAVTKLVRRHRRSLCPHSAAPVRPHDPTRQRGRSTLNSYQQGEFN